MQATRAAQPRVRAYGIALAALAAVDDDSNVDELRYAAHRDIAVGALWCVGGIVVTVATYAAAADGGTYVVAWGAIVYGAIRFVRGVIASSAGGEAPPSEGVVADSAPPRAGADRGVRRAVAVLIVTAVVVVVLAVAMSGRSGSSARGHAAPLETITLPDDIGVVDIPNPNGSGTIKSLGRVRP